MTQAGASIEAFLKLDASEFKSGMEGVKESVKTFKASFEGLEKESKESIGKVLKDIKQLQESFATIGENSILARDGFQQVQDAITSLKQSIVTLREATKEVQNFKTLAQGMNQAAEAAQRLTTVAERGGMGIEALNSILATWRAGMESATINVRGLSTALRELASSTEFTNQSTRSNSQVLANLRNTYTSTREALLTMGASLNDMSLKENQVRVQTERMAEIFKTSKQWILDFANTGVEAFNKINASSNTLWNGLSKFKTQVNATKMTLIDLWSEYARGSTALNPTVTSLERMNSAMERNRQEVMAMITGQNQETASLEKNSIAVRTNAEEKLRAMGYTGKLTIEEQRESNSINQNTFSWQRNSSAMSQASARASQLTTATSRLAKAMSSLRMIGNLVGSMLAYNFAHKLLVATGETVHAKSEMEGYFKMLNFGQNDIDHFNQALDRTVSQFQRVNKYSLGETISSIGVEFNLTTQEMEKAMKVTSMITSEYLRAGRNANEASLAVKDVLQGQFQRLSRETGVKGEQLKDAGWSGDTTDVLGLMEALEKVGMSRNWDVFAEKANSLNDILTILQNRFGEWSADMVNVVQPSIVNSFNAILSVSQGFASILSGLWEWLNTDGWGQLAVKIVGVGTALLTITQAFLSYRTGMGLVELANQGVGRSIASLVLGLKAQQIAEVGVRNSIMAKILGVNADAVAEKGVTGAIQSKLVALKEESIQNQLSATQEKLKTMATEENTVATKLNTLQQDLDLAVERELITAKEAETIQEELNTASKELNTLATLKQETANTGMIASLYLLGTGEALVTGETTALATAWGVLTGVFELSPIGFITALILGLAGAIYVLTGGLDSMWGSLQNAKKAVEDGASAIKPYKDYVNQVGQELETAKEKTGENSILTEQLSKKYEIAKDSLQRYYEKLQLTTAQHERLNDELGVTSAKMDAIMREKLGDNGYSSSELEEMTNGISDLDRLREHDYVALQRHNYLLDEFGVSVDNFAKTVHGDKDAINDFSKTYADILHYSDEVNTADNWWDWMTNSVMLNVSRASLDIQKVFHGMWDGILSDDALNFGKTIGEWWNKNVINSDWNKQLTDWLNSFSKFDLGGAIKGWFENLPDPVSEFTNWLKKGEPLIDVSWIDQWIEDTKTSITDGINQLGETLLECWNNITTYDYIGEFLKTWGLENFDFATFWNDHVVMPLTNFFSGIDLIGMIQGLFSGGGDGATGEKTFNFGEIIKGLLDFATMDLSWLPTSIDTYIIQPLKTGIVSGIMNIPLVGTILSLFGLVNGDNSGASQKGNDLATSFKNKLEEVIRNIPILGDILQLLGIIPQANPDANSKGKGVGDNIKTGFKNGLTGIVDIIKNELQHIIDAIGQRIDDAKSKAIELGNAVVNGVKSAIDPGSPGIIARSIIGDEFGTYIPQAISDNSELAYTNAQAYGQSIRDGISSVNFNTLDGMATDYQNDAQIISTTSQTMGMDTTTAFDSMALAVNNTTSTMSTNVVSAYTSMGTKQATMLTDMKTKNTTAYNEMYQKSNQSLIQMRDSTSNLTTQMTNAWSHMKNQIVATANQLKTESTTHFNTLSNTIGAFYRKIQNPSNWGAGGHTPSNVSVRTSRNPSVGKSFAHGITTRTSVHGAGGDKYTGSSTMSIAQLKRKLCPNGDCGNLFDGYSATDRVDVNEFLSAIGGEHGIGGWSGWNTTHYNHIKTTSDRWDTGSPVINLVGGIPTSAKFKVGDFETGTPNISFGEFQSMAEAIFSRIPYRLYYDSSWKGSWLGALQAGACNCSDGADALIAFAHTCNPSWSADKVHGYWGSTGHFWAVINGKVMDTTAWQGGYGWTSPKVNGYGSPDIHTRRAMHTPSENTPSESVKIEVNINGNVYGVDDLNQQIEEGIDKGLQKHFNKSYAVGI